jgi:hypothetical protein
VTAGVGLEQLTTVRAGRRSVTLDCDERIHDDGVVAADPGRIASFLLKS